jgi:intergrase/recombinase
MVSYAKQYAYCLESMNLSDLLNVRETLRPNILKALSSLAKFLGVYEDYRSALRNYGLAWSGKQADQLIIERISRVKDPDEVWRWVKQVKMERPELSDFVEFVTVSGLRLEEAVNSYNLIINLAKQDRLNEYYNEANSTLEHFRFKDLFIRRSKKAFVSFVPKDLVLRISRNHPLKSKFGVQKRVKLSGLKLRFADIREAHASILTKYLAPSEIDFLHGRVGTSVFMQNYFNPALISDLKDRVFKAIIEIQAKISL